jgi:broad specificity phosphatase PhoE
MNEQSHELWLVRHGETEWSAAGRHTGRTDVPLTGLGRCQAEALGRLLKGHAFDLILSSPLSRAVETCRLAGCGDAAALNNDLLEWDYGIYEGLTTAEIRREVPGWTIWTSDPPGGETREEVANRARKVLSMTSGARGKVALFAHGHTLRILAACWLGLSPEAGRLLALDTAAIGILGYEHESHVIRTWNRDWQTFRAEEVCHTP